MKRIQVDESTDRLLRQLRSKMAANGQNMSCHLEGMVHSKFQNYWDYLQLDILLKLQHCRTDFCDEQIFISYHQITELYFKLILSEMQALTGDEAPGTAEFIMRIKRVNRYLENLVFSFDIMVDGLDHTQFMKFRTALAPASGFQSAQFRLIELTATSLANLVVQDRRLAAAAMTAAQQYKNIYWKRGATEKMTGKKDLGLITFEETYDAVLLNRAKYLKNRNLARQLERVLAKGDTDNFLTSELRKFDNLLNCQWRLAHFRTAVKHLKLPEGAARATGGTNWQTYLPPRFQKVIFFPNLWSDTEKENWGKSFVEQYIFKTEYAGPKLAVTY